MRRTDIVDRLAMTRRQVHEHPECRAADEAARRDRAAAERAERAARSRAAQDQAAAEGHEPGTLAHTLRAAAIYEGETP